MLINFQLFYRKFGVRHLPNLAAPHTWELKWLELPLESIYHYINYDGSTSGPANDDYLFRNCKHQVPVVHTTDLTSELGNPRPIPGSFTPVIKAYHQVNRRTRWLHTNAAAALADKNTPIVYNHALLSKSVRYQQSIYSNYYRWKNIFNTVMSTAAKAAEESNRNQFLLVETPKLLPSYNQLNSASDEMSQTLLHAFTDTDSLILLELWKMLKKSWKDNDSAFCLVPIEKLHLINLIYQEAGQWFVLNVGELLSWRTPYAGEEEIFSGLQIKPGSLKLSGDQVAKRLLRMYMSVIELRTLTTKVVEESTTEVAVPETTVVSENPETDETSESEDDDETTTIGSPTPKENTEVSEEVKVLTTEPPKKLGEVEDLDELDEVDVAKLVKDEDDQIDADLEQLEVIATKRASSGTTKSAIKEILTEQESKDLSEPVKQLCEKLAANGAITAAEMNRFVKLSQNYKTIKASNGLDTLDKFIDIQPEDLSITPAENKLPEGSAVVDQSMQTSTLCEFDPKYITNVLNKDIAAAVVGVQKAGVAVVNYAITQHEDVLGQYEEHVLKLAPVVGVPSTLRFKVPVVKPDGVFTSNGVNYRMRKQQVDLPIRKTAPNKVALTSYYGKCFITRGRSNNNSFGYWLTSQLTAMVMEDAVGSFSEVIIDNVFDQTLDAPLAYSAISREFKQFSFGGIDYNFKHSELLETWPKEVISAVEKNGSIAIGKRGSDYVFIDRTGSLFAYAGGQPELIGQLPTVLGLNIKNAPVEYITVGVFGKDIPLGLVMGLEMGLQNLVQALGVKPRVVPTGQRVNLQEDEYALSFSDEVWVFSRENRLASMVLGGFNEYWKTLKSFSVYSFDKRGVYQNLLEINGLGVRYVREIDLMNQLFIDPITRDLLIEMKEPTTFKGLLVRAAQMLLTDKHPDELDPRYMRIRGYERIAGAIYTEMVQSVRMHNGKLGKKNAQIEMNPYAVWKRIMEDPAKTQAQEINPIKQLKETEAVTFAGTGGRNKRSMTKSTRQYHPNSMGTISESTVDSSDVGINIHTSANPQFTSLRGISRPFDLKRDGPTSLLSTSALLAPFSDTDD